MNNKDKIILYLDNQLSPEEKHKFEEELKNSPGLREELENYRKVFRKINELNSRPADESYFVNNIPVFRERLEKKRKVYFQKRLIYASSAAVIIMLVLSLFLFKNIEIVPGDEDSLTALSDEQINDLAGNYNILETDTALSAVADSVWDELIIDEFNFSYENADSILYSFNGGTNYADYLNEEEASLVYERLINKEFF
jgi:hypothetical protein